MGQNIQILLINCVRNQCCWTVGYFFFSAFSFYKNPGAGGICQLAKDLRSWALSVHPKSTSGYVGCNFF